MTPEQELGQKLKEALKIDFELEFQPAEGNFGDFCLPPGQVRKICTSRSLSAEELLAKIKESFAAVKLEGGYLNFYLPDAYFTSELEKFVANPGGYFREPQNAQKTVVFDYSSPNVAKPFGVGHLRSTDIGQANYNLHKLLGYKTVGINFLGDWGTQFGKLLYAIKTWGNEEKIAQNPISELASLYQKFHDEAAKNPALDEEGREWFKRLEQGEPEARALWQKCVKWSKKEFARVYQILDVTIDETSGESEYVGKAPEVVSELKDKNLLAKSEGAQIVELEGMPPAIIFKTDKTTTYITRDLAALKERLRKYQPGKIVYHIGNDQALHFRQLQKVAQQLGWLEKTTLVFAGHGLFRLKEGKMSTRAGRMVLLDEVMAEANNLTLKIIEKKNPDLPDKEKIAQKIAVSAIKYADLVSNRKSDVVFSYDKIVNLRGNSGPYLQYAYARATSLAKKFSAKYPGSKPAVFLDKEALKLSKLIIRARSIFSSAAAASAPNLVCELGWKIAEEFNHYYEQKRIISDDRNESCRKMFVVVATKLALGVIFDVLGIAKLEEI